MMITSEHPPAYLLPQLETLAPIVSQRLPPEVEDQAVKGADRDDLVQGVIMAGSLFKFLET